MNVVEFADKYRYRPPMPDDNIIIWRYMDFIKLVSLFEKDSLFFAKADSLGDSFEGSITQHDALLYADNVRLLTPTHGSELVENMIDEKSETMKKLRQLAFINCWHMNSHESSAMWSIYAKSNQGIAIRSTCKRLRESLPKEITIGMVTYIDYRKDSTPERYFLAPYFFKRVSYIHENELRAMYFDLTPHPLQTVDVDESENGKYIKTDLHLLIDEIFVAPNSPSWFLQLVENTIRKYGFNINVRRTSLDDPALF